MAAIVLGSSAVLLKVLSPGADAVDWWFVLLVGLPLAVRRRLPRTCAVLVGVVVAVQVVVGSPVGFHDAALLVALATLTGWTSRREGLVGLGVAVLLVAGAALTPWWSWIDVRVGPDPRTAHVLGMLGGFVLLAAAWAYGEQVRHAREGAAALRERAARIEREREQQAELAAAAERARIAREMHDVVAHGLSVMVLQAEGARYSLPADATVSRAALEEVARTGRTAIGEMRQLLGLLRSGPAGEAASTTLPAPGLDDLDALVAQARTTGATVVLSRAGDLGRVPPVVALTAYRVVQEALTNARRHGGDHVEVDLVADAAELVVRVHDDGRTGEDGSDGPPGLGLVGLRERVAAAGGRASAAADPRGGFTVEVGLPLDPAAAAPVVSR
ncbi:sensor histidine kinase [Microlunatus spumicola]|uniref:histidine kinase n=2 Tax=Microlunatus spumicola TaxID=81499 RepID=A0ABP6X8T2_9ACTN